MTLRDALGEAVDAVLYHVLALAHHAWCAMLDYVNGRLQPALP